MTYTFLTISTTKFSINGRTLYKTFLPVYIDDTHIRIEGMNDSKQVLISSTNVSEIQVDGNTYANSTDLINVIHEVLYARPVAGELDNAQIEFNRLAIIALDTNKSDVGHTHDDRYYTKGEVDALIPEGGAAGVAGVAGGEVDGNDMNIRDADDNLLGTIDVTELRSQGKVLEVNGYTVLLKDESGNVLDSINVIPDIVKIDAVDADGNNIDKTGKWVIGQRAGLNDDKLCIFLSNAADPTNDSHVDEVLIAK